MCGARVACKRDPIPIGGVRRVLVDYGHIGIVKMEQIIIVKELMDQTIKLMIHYVMILVNGNHMVV